MVFTFAARIPGELRYRDLAGVMVSAVCSRLERDRRARGLEWQVKSAFNEAFNNVVKHAYAGREGEVEVTLQVDDDAVVLRLVDHGPPFDFSRAGAIDAPPEFDRLSEGGMGLYLIRRLMSDVTYEHIEGLNRLTMTKRFSECERHSVVPEG